jgi:hypothetical protein
MGFIAAILPAHHENFAPRRYPLLRACRMAKARNMDKMASAGVDIGA